jgi:hypothetical protein
MVKKIIVHKLMSDSEIADREGEHFSEKFYKGVGRHIVKSDVDVYTNEGNLLLKFRKNVIPKRYTDMALDSFLEASKKKHENRGAAAGVLDRDKMPNYIGKLLNPGKFRTGFESSVSGKTSKQATSNLSQSNIVGFFDVPDRNLKGKGAPCRLTVFNRDHPDLWENGLSFIEKCDEQFKKLIPDRHRIQHRRAQSTPNFAISNTAFSTITINYSWRTALHRDKGDMEEGFGNLIVIEDPHNKNTYDGGYIGFPQYGVCVDVRTSDFLAMDVHEWHSNTEYRPRNKKVFGSPKEKDVVNGWYFNRMSVVMYLREKMIKCKDKSLWKNKAGGGYSIENDVLNSLPKEYIDYMRFQYNMFN